MKIYILTDMEGVGGVVSPDQVSASGGNAYEEARKWLTFEVNAAVEGALAGGADDVLVLDGHGANSARNLVYELLHDGARCVQGSPWTEYLQCLDGSFAGMFHIGAHAMAGTGGAVLEHTMSSESWVEMTINGRPMGEIGLCAAVAGHFGVPFAMVSGDDKACREAADIVPDIECAVVKEGLSRQCAVILPMSVVHARIRERAEAAVKRLVAGHVPPFVLEPPVEISIEYLRTSYVDGLREREGVAKIGPRQVVYAGDDVVAAFTRVLGG